MTVIVLCRVVFTAAGGWQTALCRSGAENCVERRTSIAQWHCDTSQLSDWERHLGWKN
jgi:hypothetical protein